MVRLFQHELTDDLHNILLFQWLDVRSLVSLDTAISSKTSRPYWMTLLASLRSASFDKMDHIASSLMWLVHRGICASRIQVKYDAWLEPGCDLSLLKTDELLHLGLNGNSNVTDEFLFKVVKRCRDVNNSDISGSQVMTNEVYHG